ncbi:MAG: FAD/NAD(P)-binding protein [Deltaproteobacteria bacterium]|jgi:NAD(P)H-flavin reductase|nr:FAD/NAD(P)-binding protein [Deltaproteobacteria bacterium]MBW2532771.1 FAD/NAD(P)-binding protein [Deltaproteobacteria bacterium]
MSSTASPSDRPDRTSAVVIHPYDVRRELEIQKPLDYRNRSQLAHFDQVFKSVITNIVSLTADEKLFHIRIVDDAERERFSFLPGQFVMVALPGYGEVPISISSSPSSKGHIELCIRKAGLVTGLLHAAKPGAKVGIRGPFGTHFPLGKMHGKNVLLIAGGLGLAPLRAPIYYVTENLGEFREVHIIYGARSPEHLLFDYQYESWRRIYDVKLDIIVEHPDDDWDGHVGMITDLLDPLDLDPHETYAIVCGPPVMFKFVCNKLNAMGIPMQHMFVSLERRMHCGMGKCCRCNVGSTFTCMDGPVFDYWSVLNLKEAI